MESKKKKANNRLHIFNCCNHLAVQFMAVLKLARISLKLGLACGTEDTSMSDHDRYRNLITCSLRVVHHFTCTDFGMWTLFTTLTTFLALALPQLSDG